MEFVYRNLNADDLARRGCWPGSVPRVVLFVDIEADLVIRDGGGRVLFAEFADAVRRDIAALGGSAPDIAARGGAALDIDPDAVVRRGRHPGP